MSHSASDQAHHEIRIGSWLNPYFDAIVKTVAFWAAKRRKKKLAEGDTARRAFCFVLSERFLPETPELTSLYGRSSVLLRRQ
jgi:hypothetical protein